MQYNIREFGAAGDGVALDHPAIQAAVDACAARGGGTVVVPPGRYRCGPIELRSHVRLHVEMGAVIRTADEETLFSVPGAARPITEREDVRALFRAKDVENVVLDGDGVIEGNGQAPLEYGEAHGKFRLRILHFEECRHVIVRDLRILWPDCWTLHFKHCDGVQVRGVTIRANVDRINTDGIDPDGCRNVIISDCDLECGDDCIVLKSLGGRPCEHITVTNCVLRTRCAALKLGTESYGPIRNVALSNCVIHDSAVGLSMICRDGGDYEHIAVSNLVMECCRDIPLFLSVMPRRPDGIPGEIRNVLLSGIVMRGPGRFFAMGLPDRLIRNLVVRDLTWDITGPTDMARTAKPPGTQAPAGMGDDPTLPRLRKPFQFILAHAEDVVFENVRLFDRTPEGNAARGFLHADQVRRLRVAGHRALPAPPGVEQMDTTP